MLKSKYGAKYKMFMNYSKRFIDISKTQIWHPNKEYLKDYICEGRNMAYKCKLFVAVTLTVNVISILYRYTCPYNYKS